MHFEKKSIHLLSYLDLMLKFCMNGGEGGGLHQMQQAGQTAGEKSVSDSGEIRVIHSSVIDLFLCPFSFWSRYP